MIYYTGTTVPRSAVVYKDKYPGIAMKGYFASTAWLKSNEAFQQITGESFGWFDLEDRQGYKDSKRDFRPMTQEEWEHIKPEDKVLFEEAF